MRYQSDPWRVFMFFLAPWSFGRLLNKRVLGSAVVIDAHCRVHSELRFLVRDPSRPASPFFSISWKLFRASPVVK